MHLRCHNRAIREVEQSVRLADSSMPICAALRCARSAAAVRALFLQHAPRRACGVYLLYGTQESSSAASITMPAILQLVVQEMACTEEINDDSGTWTTRPNSAHRAA